MKKVKEEKVKKGIYSTAALVLCVSTLFLFWMSNRNNNIDNANETTTITETTTKEKETVNSPVTNIPDNRYEEPTTEGKQSVYFTMPLGSSFSRDFSNGELVKNKTTGDWRVHNGVDIIGYEGDPINAICGGTVTEYRESALWGVILTIDHGNGVVAKYYGLKKSTTLQPGDKVAINTKIGELGDIPIEKAEGTHLHFEMYIDNVAVNPADYLGKRVEF